MVEEAGGIEALESLPLQGLPEPLCVHAAHLVDEFFGEVRAAA